MKYFLDTEFIEGTQKKWFSQTKPTIDLISIGVVAEDDREYYAISKDFNLKEVWNRFQIKTETHNVGHSLNTETSIEKVYWLRDNVLKPIYEELIKKELEVDLLAYNDYPFSYSSMKYLIKKYGKSNKEIAEEVYNFCSNNYHRGNILTFNQRKEYPLYDKFKPEFYAYYADYDWVVFCWLFGKMMDLPKGFPMYCIDLKQTIDYFENNIKKRKKLNAIEPSNIWNKINQYKEHPNYPKQTNEHNALSDAKWNYELYNFLNNI